jgi:hypothetical protein
MTQHQRNEIIFLALLEWKKFKRLNLLKSSISYHNTDHFYDELIMLIQNPIVYGGIAHQDVFEYELQNQPFYKEEIKLVLKKNLIEFL